VVSCGSPVATRDLPTPRQNSKNRNLVEGAGSKRRSFGVTRAGSLREMRMMCGVMGETRSEIHQQGAGGIARAEAGHHERKESMASRRAQIRTRRDCIEVGKGDVDYLTRAPVVARLGIMCAMSCQFGASS
jgi:hypothetical protein